MIQKGKGRSVVETGEMEALKGYCSLKEIYVYKGEIH
jgi:hypothetical protein